MTSNNVLILLVDDEVMLLETMAAILEYKGYKVSIAENGVKAMDLVKKIMLTSLCSI